MKIEQEALAQYAELTNALGDVEAGWIVEEVEEVLTRGKTVPFERLPRIEQARYEDRLVAETRKGIPVGKAKAADEIGVPYLPEERLTLLVQAVERVVLASARSHAFVVQFAARHGLDAVIMEQPLGFDTATGGMGAREVPMEVPDGLDAQLSALLQLLDDQVLQ